MRRETRARARSRVGELGEEIGDGPGLDAVPLDAVHLDAVHLDAGRELGAEQHERGEHAGGERRQVSPRRGQSTG